MIEYHINYSVHCFFRSVLHIAIRYILNFYPDIVISQFRNLQQLAQYPQNKAELSLESGGLHHMVSTSLFCHVLLFLKTSPKLMIWGFPSVLLFLCSVLFLCLHCHDPPNLRKGGAHPSFQGSSLCTLTPLSGAAALSKFQHFLPR